MSNDKDRKTEQERSSVREQRTVASGASQSATMSQSAATSGSSRSAAASVSVSGGGSASVSAAGGSAMREEQIEVVEEERGTVIIEEERRAAGDAGLADVMHAREREKLTIRDLRRMLWNFQSLEMQLMVSSTQRERTELRVRELERYASRLELRLRERVEHDQSNLLLEVQLSEAKAQLEILTRQVEFIQIDRDQARRSLQHFLSQQKEGRRQELVIRDEQITALHSREKNLILQIDQLKAQVDALQKDNETIQVHLEIKTRDVDALKKEIDILKQHQRHSTRKEVDVVRIRGAEASLLEEQLRAYQSHLAHLRVARQDTEIAMTEVQSSLADVSVKLEARRSLGSEIIFESTYEESESSSFEQSSSSSSSSSFSSSSSSAAAAQGQIVGKIVGPGGTRR